jgi:hypothetical protein
MKVVTMNDIKRILTPDVMRTLESLAEHLSTSFGVDYNTALRDLAVKWVARELNNK